MKDNYDFANATRGKFFKDNATHHLPVYLDNEIQTYLQERAQSKGIGLNQLVNELLKQDIKLIETAK